MLAHWRRAGLEPVNFETEPADHAGLVFALFSSLAARAAEGLRQSCSSTRSPDRPALPLPARRVSPRRGASRARGGPFGTGYLGCCCRALSIAFFSSGLTTTPLPSAFVATALAFSYCRAEK